MLKKETKTLRRKQQKLPSNLGPKSTRTFRISDELMNWIDEYAAVSGMNKSSVVEIATREYLESVYPKDGDEDDV